MTLEVKRWLAGVLAVTAAVVGTWAAAFPMSFYNDFPGFRRGWVSTLSPYSEHLIRDVGALYLALLVLSILLLVPVRSGAEDRDVAWSGNG